MTFAKHVMAAAALLLTHSAWGQQENFSVGEFSHREVDYKSAIDGLEIVRVNPLVFDSSQSFEYGTAKQSGWEWDFETRASPGYSVLPSINIMSLGRVMPLNFGAVGSGMEKYNAQRGYFFRYSYLKSDGSEAELVDLQTDTRQTFKEAMIAQNSYRSMLLQTKTTRDGTTIQYEYDTSDWHEGFVCPNITIRHVPSNNTLVVRRATPWQLGIASNASLSHCLPVEVTLPNGVSKIFYDWVPYAVQPNWFQPYLSAVRYPDGTKKTYEYAILSDTADGFTVMRPGLAAVVDEEGKRTTYQWQGNKVVSVSYGSPTAPQGKISVVNNIDGTRTITDADGIARTIKMTSWEKSVGAPGTKPVKFKRFAGMSSPCQWCDADFKDIKYNTTGLPTQMTDQRGVITQITRNETTDILQRETSRVVGSGQPEAKTISTTYDSRFNLPIKQITSDSTGSFTTETAYDAAGRPTRLTYSQSSKLLSGTPVSVTRVTNISYTFHPNGQIKTMTVDGPRTDVSDTVVATFDAASRLLSIADASGTTSYSLYDGNSLPQRITYPNGTTTNLSYDWAGRVLTSTTAGVTTTNSYYRNGLLKTSTTPGTSETTTYYYNDANRLTRVSDAAGNRIDYTYSTLGRNTSVKSYDAAGTLIVSRFINHDTANLGRTIAETNGSLPGITTTRLNENFEVIESIDPLSKSTLLTRDALGRVKASAFSTLNASSSFDVADNLKSSTYSAGVATRNQTFSYVGYADGSLLNSNDSDTGTETFTLNEAGDLIQSANSLGAHRINHTRDALGRVTKTTYTNATTGALLATVNFGYDANPDGSTPAPTGQLTSISGSFGVVQYTFDSKGYLKQKSQSRSTGASKTDSYLRDGAGRVTQITYPSGREVKMTLDAVGRPSAITTRTLSTATWNTVADLITYPPGAELDAATSMRFGGGTQVAQRKYDAAGRVSAYSDGTNLVSVVRRNDGQISNIKVGTTVNGTYDYDDKNRLKSASGTGFSAFTYAFEGTGDVTSIKEGTVTTAATYTANSSRIASFGGSTWTYTQDGLVASAGDLKLTYDARGLVATAQKGTGPVTTYTYDALGQRMSKKPAGGTAIDYAYDAEGHLIAEFDPVTGTTFAEYIWLGDRPVMFIIPGTTEARYFIYTDYSNTPIRLTSSTGTTVWQWQRDPFGKVAPNVATVTFNLRMPGQYFDAETGLHYNNARYYHPASGRYLQADPLGEAAGISAYTYADGDAVNLVDPSGLAPGVVDLGTLPVITVYGSVPRRINFQGSYTPGSLFTDAEVYGGSDPFDPQGINFSPPAEHFPPAQVENAKITGTVAAILSHPEIQAELVNIVVALAMEKIPGMKIISRVAKSVSKQSKLPDLDKYDPGAKTAFVGVLNRYTNKYAVVPGNRTVMKDGTIPPLREFIRDGAHIGAYEQLTGRPYNGLGGVMDYIGFTVHYMGPQKIGLTFKSNTINREDWGRRNLAGVSQATGPVVDLIKKNYPGFSVEILK